MGSQNSREEGGGESSGDNTEPENVDGNPEIPPGVNLRHRRRTEAEDEERGAALEPRRHQGGQRGPDVVGFLENLLQTGQLRVMPRRRRVDADGDPFPPAKRIVPDTSRMDNSDFRQQVLSDSAAGLSISQLQHIPYGSVPFLGLHEFRRLRQCEKVQLLQQCIPNHSSKLLEIEDKIFCGLHSEDGNILLTGGQDHTIRISDTSKGIRPDGNFRLIREIDARDVGWSILDVRLSTCGRYLAYSSWSDSIHLATVKDNSTHNPIRLNPDQHHAIGVFSLMFSHDDREILCGANQGDLYVCNLLNGHSQRIVAHEEDVNCVAFADHTSQILYSSGDDGVIKVWDRRNLSEQNPRPCGLFVGHMHGITYLDAHSDGRHLLSNGKDQCIKLWDIRKFSTVDSLDEARRAVAKNRWDYRYRPREPVSHRKLKNDASIMTYTGHMVCQTLIRARFSPSTSTASGFIYCGDARGCVYIFDALTGETVRRLVKHTGVVRDVSWHPSRPEIVSSSWDGSQLLWSYKGDLDEDTQDGQREKAVVDSDDD